MDYRHNPDFKFRSLSHKYAPGKGGFVAISIVIATAFRSMLKTLRVSK